MMLSRPALPPVEAALRSLVLLLALLPALLPLSLLLQGSAWITLPLLGAAPLILVGALARQVVRAPALVPGLQLLVLFGSVAAVAARGGLVPPGTPWHGVPGALLAAVTTGLQEISSGIAPLEATAATAVGVVLAAGLVALCLDLLVAELGWHTPAALAVGGFALAPALQAPGGGPWWAVAGPVLGACVLLALRTLRPDPAQAVGDTRPQAGPLHRPRGTAAAATVVIAMVTVGAVPLGGALPALTGEQVPLSVARLRTLTGDTTGAGVGPQMVDASVSVRRSLLQRGDIPVLDFTTDGPDPGYLRVQTLTRFDGTNWVPGGDAPTVGLDSPSDAVLEVDPQSPPEGVHSLAVRTVAAPGPFLPTPGFLRGAALTSGAGSASQLSTTQRLGELLLTGQRPQGPIAYTTAYEHPQPMADQLRAVPVQEFERARDAETVRVAGVPALAEQEAHRILEEAGNPTTAYDTAMALADHFHSDYTYSLTATTPPGEDPLESFLREKVGYCEQYAATFALMMNALGYPTRVVVGYTAGTADGRTHRVTTANAHAWPEVWFGRYGWLPVEPTPGEALQGATPAAPAEAADEPGETASAQTPSADTPSPRRSTASPEPERSSTQSSAAATPSDGAAETPAAEQTDGPGPLALTVLLTVLFLGLFGAVATCVVLLRRRRAAALRAGPVVAADPRQAALAAWESIEESLARQARRDRATGALAVRDMAARPPLQLSTAAGPERALIALAEQLIDRRSTDRSEEEPDGPDRERHEQALREAAGRLGQDVLRARYGPPVPAGEAGTEPAATAARIAADAAVMRREILRSP